MDPQEPTPKKNANSTGREGACQVCGKKGAVVFDPEKAPPNRLCYRCAMEYGMQEQDDR